MSAISKLLVRKAGPDSPTTIRVSFTTDLSAFFKMLSGVAIVANLNGESELREANTELFGRALHYVNETPALDSVVIPWLGPAVIEDNRSHVFAISESLKASGWKFHEPTAAEAAEYLRQNV